MTLAKRLLLGTAAAFVATSGAHAADLGLPVAPSVDYVQICSIGSFTGFLLPGSDVCFDISGFARFQATFNGEGDDAGVGVLASATYTDTAAGSAGYTSAVTRTPTATQTDDDDDFDMIGAFELNFDARTMTEWGLLRGFIRIDSEGEDDPQQVDLEKAFIQIGGLTAGLTDSFFDPVWTDYAMAPFGDTAGTDDLSLIGYSMSIGNGLTFSASLENGEARNTGVLSYIDQNRNVIVGSAVPAAAAAGSVTVDTDTGLYTVAAFGTGGYAGFNTFGTDSGYDESATMPDFVASLRVDQAWGSAKLSAALHEVDPFQESVDSEIGYAAGASAEFNLPVGYGSTFGVFGNYAYGAVSYVGLDNQVAGTTLPYVDAIYDAAANDLDLTTAWGLGAGVNIGITEMISWQLEGYYTSVDHADITVTVVDELAVAGTVAADEILTETIDYDGNVLAVRTSVTYVPFSGLSLQAGVSYQVSDFDAAAVGSDANDDQFGARLRITRSF